MFRYIDAWFMFSLHVILSCVCHEFPVLTCLLLPFLSFFFSSFRLVLCLSLCLCRNVVSYYFCGTPTVGAMRQCVVLLMLRVSIRPVIAPNINAFVNTFANIWQLNREASWNFSIFYIGWRFLIVTVALINPFFLLLKLKTDRVKWNLGGFLLCTCTYFKWHFTR